MRYVYLMNASRARSLKRDGRDHSSSTKQPAVAPSALARGSQPAASPDGLWSRPSSDNDLALLAFIKYTYRTVSNALTYLQHSATSPRASIFLLRQSMAFLEQLAYSWAPTSQQVFTTIWSLQSSSGRDNDVYSRQTVGGQSVATCLAVIRALVLALSDSRIQL